MYDVAFYVKGVYAHRMWSKWNDVEYSISEQVGKDNEKECQEKTKKIEKLLGNEKIKFKSVLWKSFGMYNFSIKFIMIL